MPIKRGLHEMTGMFVEHRVYSLCYTGRVFISVFAVLNVNSCSVYWIIKAEYQHILISILKAIRLLTILTQLYGYFIFLVVIQTFMIITIWHSGDDGKLTVLWLHLWYTHVHIHLRTHIHCIESLNFKLYSNVNFLMHWCSNNMY